MVVLVVVVVVGVVDVVVVVVPVKTGQFFSKKNKKFKFIFIRAKIFEIGQISKISAQIKINLNFF